MQVRPFVRFRNLHQHRRRRARPYYFERAGRRLTNREPWCRATRRLRLVIDQPQRRTAGRHDEQGNDSGPAMLVRVRHAGQE